MAVWLFKGKISGILGFLLLCYLLTLSVDINGRERTTTGCGSGNGNVDRRSSGEDEFLEDLAILGLEENRHDSSTFFETTATALHSYPASPRTEVVFKVDSAILCELCNGKGWLLCDFCEGQKTNVQAANKRIYRRCPSCKAIGYVLCSKCKVFKCVTFPDYGDGEDLIV